MVPHSNENCLIRHIDYPGSARVSITLMKMSESGAVTSPYDILIYLIIFVIF